MALEKGIAIQVREFIDAGRPSSRAQSIDDRRRGYIASTVLAGEQEKRVQVEDIELEGMTFRIVSPSTPQALSLRSSIFTAAALSAVVSPRMTISSVSWLTTAAAGLSPCNTGWRRSTLFPPPMTMLKKAH